MYKTLILSIVVTLALIGGLARADLVGHWKLDEGSGDVAHDSSGNGNDGNLVGNPQWVAGKIGGALEFDGTGSIVDIPYVPEMTPPTALRSRRGSFQRTVPEAASWGSLKATGWRSWTVCS